MIKKTWIQFDGWSISSHLKLGLLCVIYFLYFKKLKYYGFAHRNYLLGQMKGMLINLGAIVYYQF